MTSLNLAANNHPSWIIYTQLWRPVAEKQPRTMAVERVSNEVFGGWMHYPEAKLRHKLQIIALAALPFVAASMLLRVAQLVTFQWLLVAIEGTSKNISLEKRVLLIAKNSLYEFTKLVFKTTIMPLTGIATLGAALWGQTRPMDARALIFRIQRIAALPIDYLTIHKPQVSMVDLKWLGYHPCMLPLSAIDHPQIKVELVEHLLGILKHSADRINQQLFNYEVQAVDGGACIQISLLIKEDTKTYRVQDIPWKSLVEAINAVYTTSISSNLISDKIDQATRSMTQIF